MHQKCFICVHVLMKIDLLPQINEDLIYNIPETRTPLLNGKVTQVIHRVNNNGRLNNNSHTIYLEDLPDELFFPNQVMNYEEPPVGIGVQILSGRNPYPDS